MSFDLYFLKCGRNETWDDAMAAVEAAAEHPVPWTGRHQVVWDEIERRVRSVLPQVEIVVRESGRELDQQESGIQLSMESGVVSLTVPYWAEGPDD